VESNINELLNLFVRWLHIVGGVLWIGHLWFVSFVLSRVIEGYDARTRQTVVPDLLTRILGLFRWSSVLTWVTGFFLLGIVYYSGGVGSTADQSAGLASASGIAALFAAWIVYDTTWVWLAKSEIAGVLASLASLSALSFGLAQVMSGRSLFIHLGAVFGTIILGNVWRRVLPGQRALVNALRGGTTPPADAMAMVGLRTRHNTYLSVPLLFFMVSNHFPIVYGNRLGWLIAVGVVAVGWLATRGLYARTA
jgi:uncharacterized membrane protein